MLVGLDRIIPLAPEQASYAPAIAAEPMPQRRMMAKLEPAAGLVTIFRNSGKSCSAAASNKGNVRGNCLIFRGQGFSPRPGLFNYF